MSEISGEIAVNTGAIVGELGVGRYIINDYTLTITAISNGYQLEIRRGSEVQTVNLLGMSAEEIAAVANDAQAASDAADAADRAATSATNAAGDADRAATAANNAAETANGIANRLNALAFTINSDMELEVEY